MYTHTHTREDSEARTISDDDLYSLAIFLGILAMLLIVVYHFLEINAKKSGDEGEILSEGHSKTLSSSASVVGQKDEIQNGGKQQAAGAAGRGGK